MFLLPTCIPKIPRKTHLEESFFKAYSATDAVFVSFIKYLFYSWIAQQISDFV